jgi:hypothetical protein
MLNVIMLSMILKVYLKNLVSFRLVQNLEILDLAMERVGKVNIAVYLETSGGQNSNIVYFFNTNVNLTSVAA